MNIRLTTFIRIKSKAFRPNVINTGRIIHQLPNFNHNKLISYVNYFFIIKAV
jgi:hypothetical protein